MKLGVVCRKIYNYIWYDLKEITFPSSLPNSTHIKKRQKLTWKERYLVRDIGLELGPNDYKKAESEDTSNGEKGTTKEKEPSTLEDLVVAARGGMETLKPALQRVYMTRTSAYRDVLKNFIKGYQEGIQQVMEKKEDSKSQSKADLPKR
ncbi:embryo defective 2735 [Perilla frutescens var. hirtella]|nr:embryo defective 2735 [Perilla frutescens var. hirtella]